MLPLSNKKKKFDIFLIFVIMNCENQKNFTGSQEKKKFDICEKNTNMNNQVITSMLENIILGLNDEDKKFSKTTNGIAIEHEDGISIVNLGKVLDNEDAFVDGLGDCFKTSLTNLKSLYSGKTNNLFWVQGIMRNAEEEKIWHCWIENTKFIIDEQFGKKNLVKKEEFYKRVVEAHKIHPKDIPKKQRSIVKTARKLKRKYPGC